MPPKRQRKQKTEPKQKEQKRTTKRRPRKPRAPKQQAMPTYETGYHNLLGLSEEQNRQVRVRQLDTAFSGLQRLQGLYSGLPTSAELALRQRETIYGTDVQNRQQLVDQARQAEQKASDEAYKARTAEQTATRKKEEAQRLFEQAITETEEGPLGKRRIPVVIEGARTTRGRRLQLKKVKGNTQYITVDSIQDPRYKQWEKYKAQQAERKSSKDEGKAEMEELIQQGEYIEVPKSIGTVKFNKKYYMSKDEYSEYQQGGGNEVVDNALQQRQMIHTPAQQNANRQPSVAEFEAGLVPITPEPSPRPPPVPPLTHSMFQRVEKFRTASIAGEPLFNNGSMEDTLPTDRTLQRQQQIQNILNDIEERQRPQPFRPEIQNILSGIEERKKKRLQQS